MDSVLNFIDFLKTSTNPYEAVKSLKEMLVSMSYTELNEYSKYDIKKGEKYFVTRNNSSIIAFQIPTDLSDLSFNISASHTDSPTFKIKPNNDHYYLIILDLLHNFPQFHL